MSHEPSRRKPRVNSPADVGHAREFVSGVDIEDVFDCESGAEQVTTGGVDDTLRLAGRARGLWRE